MMKDNIVDLEKYKQIHSPEKLLELDPSAAEKSFNKLSLKKKVNLVLSASWEKRMEIILLAENSRELLQALPEEEVYWTVMERGPEDSLALISRTTHEQFQYMLDIDCWNKDSIDSPNVAKWYRLLGRCDVSKVIEWFRKADDEFIICSLKKIVEVFKITGESDISEEYEKMPSYTIDNVNYFKFIDDDARLYIVPLFNALYEHDRGRFNSIIEGIIWDLEIETQEEAFRWRQARIAEKGFPDYDEALNVYQTISDREIELLLKGLNIETDSDFAEEKNNRPGINLRYGFVDDKTPHFFFKVIHAIKNEQDLELIQRYMLNLANKIIIADNLETREIDAMKSALGKVEGYINIGLEFLSEGEIISAEKLLQKTHPAILFRIGYSLILKLKKRLEEGEYRFWINSKEFFATFFNSPWADAVEGFNRKRPLFFEGVLEKGSIQYRDFVTLNEVKETDRVIDIVAAVERLLIDFFMLKPENLSSDFVSGTNLNDAGELKVTSVFLTILAGHILYNRTELVPLTADDLKIFLGKVFERNQEKDSYVLKKDLYRDALAWIYSISRFDEPHKTALEAFVLFCLNILEEEFSLLAANKMIETKYVSGLILKKVL